MRVERNQESAIGVISREYTTIDVIVKKKKSKTNWQPISVLPTIASVIDAMLEDTEIQYRMLLEAKDKPYVLDDKLVFRVIKVFKTQHDDLGVYKEQLSRWKRLTLNVHQEQEIQRLTKQVDRIHKVTESILCLADELKENTIDQIMKRDDLQIAIDFLSGKLRPY